MSQIWLGSRVNTAVAVAVAVAVADSCSSDLIPSLGTSICHECGPKKRKKKRKEEGRRKEKKERYLT